MKRSLIAILLMFSSTIHAQQRVSYTLNEKIRNVKVGDSVPDVFIPNIINGEVREAYLHEFSGELLILDFWATSCSSCIAHMPDLGNLVKRFDNKLQILPITYEGRERVMSFWSGNRFTKNVDLPVVTEDSLLASYFKHRAIPHYVWIRQGRVVAITGQEYVNDENIDYILQGNTVTWPIKRDMFYFDYDRPMVDLNINEHALVPPVYSAQLPYKEAVDTKFGVSVDTIGKKRRIYMTNVSIVQAYFIALTKSKGFDGLIRPSIFLTPNQVVLEVSDPSKYMFEVSGEQYMAAWKERNAVCLESSFPDYGQQDSSVFAQFLVDLDRLLGLSGRWERRTVGCLILEEIEDAEDKAMHKPSSNSKEIEITNLLFEMNRNPENPPVFDGRTRQESLRIYIPEDGLSDVATINLALKPHGYRFVFRLKEIDQLVITELTNIM